jgi:asparagine synthetase B (glutamine-hydrolysing)
MIDKQFCMSSYLAFRYIEREGTNFYEGLKTFNIPQPDESQLTYVHTVEDIDREIQKVFDNLKGEKLGICLSGGMDSAILASYMRGQEAYTFRFLGGEFMKEELARAEYYANYYGLHLHYVDIDWNTVEKYLPIMMRHRNAPVHSIEPQLYQAALQAKADGVTHLIVGESSDLIFGGMDKLLAKDWTMEEFEKRYTFLDPALVLKEPVSMHYLFEKYQKDGKFDFMDFMDNVFSIESSSTYYSAFGAAGIPYTDPYSKLRMADPLDLHRVRNGEPKYLVRGLYAIKYPELEIPFKIPMPRPVDAIFKEWEGPKRLEFRKDIPMKE